MMPICTREESAATMASRVNSLDLAMTRKHCQGALAVQLSALCLSCACTAQNLCQYAIATIMLTLCSVGLCLQHCPQSISTLVNEVSINSTQSYS